MYRFERDAYEKRMQWFREARFGLFLHWGLYAIPARGEWVRNQEQMPEKFLFSLLNTVYMGCISS